MCVCAESCKKGWICSVNSPSDYALKRTGPAFDILLGIFETSAAPELFRIVDGFSARLSLRGGIWGRRDILPHTYRHSSNSNTPPATATAAVALLPPTDLQQAAAQRRQAVHCFQPPQTGVFTRTGRDPTTSASLATIRRAVRCQTP